MKILGIDPALTVTGYGLINADNNRLSVIEAGIIKTEARTDLPERLRKIYTAVSELVVKHKPEALVLEKLYAHYRHPVTAFLLGQARGVICLVCAFTSVALVEYGATRIKKAIVGSGHASKEQIQRMVCGVLNIKELPKYSDVTDALALAMAHSYIIRARL